MPCDEVGLRSGYIRLDAMPRSAPITVDDKPATRKTPRLQTFFLDRRDLGSRSSNSTTNRETVQKLFSLCLKPVPAKMGLLQENKRSAYNISNNPCSHNQLTLSAPSSVGTKSPTIRTIQNGRATSPHSAKRFCDLRAGSLANFSVHRMRRMLSCIPPRALVHPCGAQG